MSEQKTKKTNFFAKWFKEFKSEIKKIVWPSKKQVINNTGIVLVVIFAIGAFIFVFDLGATFGIDKLLGLKG